MEGLIQASALMGTERAPLRLPDSAPPLLTAIASRSPEHVLLSAAALSGLQRQAGARPPITTTLPPPAPDETLRVVSPVIGDLIWAMVAQRITTMLTVAIEVFSLMHSKGLRVPHWVLPTLFDFLYTWGNDPQTAYAISLVIGERGHWFAAQNSRYKSALKKAKEVSLALTYMDNAELDDLLTKIEQSAQDKKVTTYLQALTHSPKPIPQERLREARTRLHLAEREAKYSFESVLNLIDLRYELLRLLNAE